MLSSSTSAPWNGSVTKSDLENKKREKENHMLEAYLI